MQQNQRLMQIVRKLQQTIQTKQPELDLKKFIAELNAMTQIRDAQEKNKNDAGERDANMLENILNLAHEAASDSADRVHDMMMQNDQQDHEQNLAQTPPPVDPNAQQQPPTGTQ
jgi:hypothetical protein